MYCLKKVCMNSLKKVDMNIVNCVLLLVVLILVLLCCYNKEQFQTNIKPNCNTLHPCVNGGVNTLSGERWNKDDPLFKRCQSDMYLFPEEIYNSLGGQYNNNGDPHPRDKKLMDEALSRSCRQPPPRNLGGNFSTLCNNRKLFNDAIEQKSGLSRDIVNECNIDYDGDNTLAASGSKCRIPEDSEYTCAQNINDGLWEKADVIKPPPLERNFNLNLPGVAPLNPPRGGNGYRPPPTPRGRAPPRRRRRSRSRSPPLGRR